MLGRHYLLPMFSNIIKGSVWLGLAVLKWRAPLVTVQRQLGKLFLTVFPLLAVIFKLKGWCLAVSYFECCKNFEVPGAGQIFCVDIIFKCLTILNYWDERKYLLSRRA